MTLPRAIPLPSDEPRITAKEAAAYVQERYNRPCSPATIYSWAKCGRNGHRLNKEHAFGAYGRQMVTTEGEIDRFIAQWMRSHDIKVADLPRTIRMPE